jgi:adenylate kinase
VLRVVLIAPPGSGKGTQGARLSALYRVPHIAIGEILRSEVASGTTTGQLVAELLEVGELVPDALVLRVVTEALTALDGGFILDGFPRTLNQAVAAEQGRPFARRPLHAAIELQVSDEELVWRLRRRSSLSLRSDDSEKTIRSRLALYRRSAIDLVEYYRGRKLLITIDGTGAVGDVTTRIVAELRVISPPPDSTKTNGSSMHREELIHATEVPQDANC